MKIAYTFIFLLCLWVDLFAQEKTIPEYLEISHKVISAGIEGYSTPLFNISESGHEILAKIVYLPEYVNKTSSISLYIQENDDSIVQELIQITKDLSRTATYEKYASAPFEITIKAATGNIWTNSILLGNSAYSMMGLLWDEQEIATKQRCIWNRYSL